MPYNACVAGEGRRHKTQPPEIREGNTMILANDDRDRPLFELGAVRITPRAAALLEGEAGTFLWAAVLLTRHQFGDWGSIHPDDRGLNEQALKHGGRIMSVYPIPGNDSHVIWIITEADRSATTVLLPSEY